MVSRMRKLITWQLVVMVTCQLVAMTAAAGEAYNMSHVTSLMEPPASTVVQFKNFFDSVNNASFAANDQFYAQQLSMILEETNKDTTIASLAAIIHRLKTQADALEDSQEKLLHEMVLSRISAITFLRSVKALGAEDFLQLWRQIEATFNRPDVFVNEG